MTAGIKEQLAAALVQRSSGESEARLVIHGTPGDWSVGVENATPSGDCLWLAATRTPSVMRCFKSLDAANAAAQEIHKLTDPLADQKYVSVRVICRWN